MTVSRLAHIPGIGVNVMGDRADAAADPTMLRMENLDTDLRPPAVAGPSGDRYLRLVFANEPVERLHDLRERFGAAL